MRVWPSKSAMETSMQFDLVTVGGGFSGLVPACRAAELDLSVAVLEARTEKRYPCSSRFATGATNVMGLPIMAEPEKLFRAIMDGSGRNAQPAIARAIADNGKRTIAWLTHEGARFTSRALRHEQPGQQVLAPPRSDTAGLDWEDRGADLLMQRLEQNLTQRGGILMRGTTVESLVVEDDACVGVNVVRDGQRLQIRANTVVIADGGFAANPDMVAKYITPRADRVLARVGPGAKGDGIRMAERAGAAVGGFGAFYGHIHHRSAMTNAQQWPYPHLDAAAEVGILVGPDGKRFTDEGRGGVCMANAIAKLADPLSAFLILDDAIWQMEPTLTTTVPANPTMIDAGGEKITASDITALAARIAVPQNALTQAISDYNQAVDNNNLARLAVPRSIRKHKPMPIRTPPFHAIPLCAGVTGTMGGVVINEHAQALRPDGTTFPGLYAVGTPVAGLEGGPRAGYVGGLSKAFILGLLAAEHSAKYTAAAR
jgi:fumarate reductase flavoprotein subunit